VKGEGGAAGSTAVSTLQYWLSPPCHPYAFGVVHHLDVLLWNVVHPYFIKLDPCLEEIELETLGLWR
jgi:hypothetical protein